MMNNDKTFVLASCVVSVFLVFGYLEMFYTERVTEDVIQSLRRDYSPGPYNPGFDLDEVSPDLWQSRQQHSHQPPVSVENPTNSFQSSWEESRR